MTKKLKVYISNSYDPYYNLALEKHLLNSVCDGEIILYLWQNQSTVVIGVNQNPYAECNCQLMQADNVKLARRLSGGGAVYHDLGNLNFTFITRTKNNNISKNMQVIKKALAYEGIEAEISGRNDILVKGKKISGNAFYNSNGNSYHHGTLLVNADFNKMSQYLTPSELKLKAKGVKSVKSRVLNLVEVAPDINCEKLKQSLIQAFKNEYNLDCEIIDNISDCEVLTTSKHFSSWEFLYGNTAPFSLCCEDRFEWGSISLNLDVKKGVITAVEVYTDAMDFTLAQTIKSSLLNCRFKFNDIEKVLIDALPLQYATDILKTLLKIVK